MYRTLLLLLYGTGMRIGEALRLTLQDVDLAERSSPSAAPSSSRHVWFRSDRSSTDELVAHVERRGLLPMPLGKHHRYSPRVMVEDGAIPASSHSFSMCAEPLVSIAPSANLRPPRLHDLRHTAAVHRVVAWYRSGQDVQRLLPQLATYLGHIDIRSTQRYLQMTSELLEVASQRFALYATEAGHEG